MPLGKELRHGAQYAGRNQPDGGQLRGEAAVARGTGDAMPGNGRPAVNRAARSMAIVDLPNPGSPSGTVGIPNGNRACHSQFTGSAVGSSIRRVRSGFDGAFFGGASARIAGVVLRAGRPLPWQDDRPVSLVG